MIEQEYGRDQDGKLLGMRQRRPMIKILTRCAIARKILPREAVNIDFSVV